MKLKEGQSWYYTKSNDQDSFLMVQSIDEINKIVHVSINVSYKSGEVVFIAHMPFSESILLESLEEPRNDYVPRRFDEFKEAFNIWDEQQGGIWEVSVDEAVQMTLNAVE